MPVCLPSSGANSQRRGRRADAADDDPVDLAVGERDLAGHEHPLDQEVAAQAARCPAFWRARCAPVDGYPLRVPRSVERSPARPAPSDPQRYNECAVQSRNRLLQKRQTPPMRGLSWSTARSGALAATRSECRGGESHGHQADRHGLRNHEPADFTSGKYVRMYVQVRSAGQQAVDEVHFGIGQTALVGDEPRAVRRSEVQVQYEIVDAARDPNRETGNAGTSVATPTFVFVRNGEARQQ